MAPRGAGSTMRLVQPTAHIGTESGQGKCDKLSQGLIAVTRQLGSRLGCGGQRG